MPAPSNFARAHRSEDYPARKDPDTGKPLCRYCAGPVKPPKRTFCSPACVQQMLIRVDPGVMRRHTFNRDKGVCALCHTDTERLRESVEMFQWHAANPEPHRRPHKQTKLEHEQLWAVWEKRRHLERSRREAEMEKLRAAGWPHPSRTWWEADHIVPVAEGGGGCGLENIQTLCVLCHRGKTAEQAGRRAQARQCSRVTPGQSEIDGVT